MAAVSWPIKPLPTVPSSAALWPNSENACASQWEMDVLPLVPVMPITVIAWLGWPNAWLAITPARARSSGTARLGVAAHCSGQAKPSAESHSTAAAPLQRSGDIVAAVGVFAAKRQEHIAGCTRRLSDTTWAAGPARR